MAFPLSKYNKGKAERGYLLGTTEELSQALDESILKLQSMSSSQSVLMNRFYLKNKNVFLVINLSRNCVDLLDRFWLLCSI